MQLKVTTKTTTNTVAKGKVTKPKQLINPPQTTKINRGTTKQKPIKAIMK